MEITRWRSKLEAFVFSNKTDKIKTLNIPFPLPVDMLHRAFRFVRGLHPDDATAERIVLAAASDFFGPLRRQSGEEEVESGSGPITLSEADLFQISVFETSDKWAHDQEKRQLEQSQQPGIRGNVYRPTPNDMLVRYVAFLVSRTMLREWPHVVLGLGRHLYQYQTDELGRLISHLFPITIVGEEQNEASSVSRFLAESSNHRGRLFRTLRIRFPTLDVYETTTEGGTIRTREPTDVEKNLVSTTLDYVTPWGTDCPGGLSVPRGLFCKIKAKEHFKRIHALVHTECAGLQGLITGYNTEIQEQQPDNPLTLPSDMLGIPKFSSSDPLGTEGDNRRTPTMPPDSEDDMQGTERFNAKPLSDRQINTILDGWSRSHYRRTHYRTGLMTVYIDGEERAQFDPREGPCPPLQVWAGATHLQVFGRDDDGAFVIAMVLLHNMATTEGKRRVTLDSGHKLLLTVSDISEETEQFRLQLTCRETWRASLKNPFKFLRALWAERTSWRWRFIAPVLQPSVVIVSAASLIMLAAIATYSLLSPIPKANSPEVAQDVRTIMEEELEEALRELGVVLRNIDDLPGNGESVISQYLEASSRREGLLGVTPRLMSSANVSWLQRRVSDFLDLSPEELPGFQSLVSKYLELSPDDISKLKDAVLRRDEFPVITLSDDQLRLMNGFLFHPRGLSPEEQSRALHLLDDIRKKKILQESAQPSESGTSAR